MQIEQRTVSMTLYLISCALHDSKPDTDMLDKALLNEIFRLSKMHSLSAIVYSALQKTDFLQYADPDVARKWKEVREKTIRKNIMLDAERKQIFKEFEARRIWYMPLKGSVLKTFYPHEGMREMTDNDILFDADYQEQVRDVFIDRGYKAVSFAKGNHDVYEKKPIYNFEMHTSLFSMRTYPELAEAFENITEKFLPDTDSLYGRHLDYEDFYIYMTAHSYKHYIYAGTGLRTIVDCYVMNEAFKETLDRAYVTDQLHRLGIDNYEKQCRSLACHIFEKDILVDTSVLPSEEQILLEHFISSGTYGTIEKRFTNILSKYSSDGSTIDREAKIRYCMQRLFPGMEWYKEKYPFFYKIPILIPFLWIYRLLRAFLFRWKKIGAEIKRLIMCNRDTKKSHLH